MALFERSKRSPVDQTDPIRAEIQGSESLNGYTAYILNVTKGYGATAERWQVRRRYSDFQNLYERLKLTNFPAKLPPKKLIGNLNRDFISQRLDGLQVYLNEILSQPLLIRSLIVWTFLHPNKVNFDKSDEAKQLVSFYMRSTHKWETTESFSFIGWRLDKHHFEVRPQDDKKAQLILSWSFYGPDLSLGAHDLNEILHKLRQIKHPYLSSIQTTWCGDQGGLVVRNKYANGSLRDVLRKAVPNQFYLEKYGWARPTNHLDLKDVKLFGYQILIGLQFLQQIGIPFTNIHCGNIFVVGDTIEISDFEDDLIGLASCYRPQFIQCKAVKSVEDATVYCLGLTFFEMATGKQLKTPAVINMPTCVDSVAALINRILSSRAVKTQMPKLSELLSDQFFADVANRIKVENSNGADFSESQRKCLDGCRQTIETRLARDQVSFRKEENDKKFRRFISSDEGQVHMKSLSSQISIKSDSSSEPAESEKSCRNEDSPNGEVSLGKGGTAGFVLHSHTNSSAQTNHSPRAAGLIPPPPPPPPPPLLNLSSSNSNASSSSLATGGSVEAGGDGEQRNALLDSVRNFNRSRLKTVGGGEA